MGMMREEEGVGGGKEEGEERQEKGRREGRGGGRGQGSVMPRQHHLTSW